MKPFNYIIIFVVIYTLMTCNSAHSSGLQWSFTHSADNVKAPKTVVEYSVTNEASIIKSTEEIIHIDYTNHILYRYSKKDDQCTQFALSLKPHPSESSKEEQINMLVSSYRLFQGAENKVIDTYKCSRKSILFGADLALSQMVSSPRVKKFNQYFTESMVGYFVSDKINGYNVLLKIAKNREKVYQNNPLLRQIDIIGLLDILDGFPIQILQKRNGVSIVRTLTGAVTPIQEQHTFPPPAACGHLPREVTSKQDLRE